MNWITFLSGPIIGAVIGYCTNYIAVKMLFRPRNAVFIGKKQLPFTPGIIPKRKAALGAAIGKAVENDLFSGEDVKRILAGDACKDAVSSGVASMMETTLSSDTSTGERLKQLMGETSYEDAVLKVRNNLADRIRSNVSMMNLGGVVAETAGVLIPQYLGNPMIAMFLTPELLNQFAEPINQGLTGYLEGEGAGKLDEILDREITSLTEKTPSELIALPDFGSAMKGKVGDLYEDFVEKHAAEIAGAFNIRETVETRIADMSNEELEKLVLSVMKKELNAIVNLGALIGFILGLLNTLF